MEGNIENQGYEYLQEFLKSDRSFNYLNTHLGKNPALDNRINNTIYILFSLVASHKMLMAKSEADSGRKDVKESIMFLGRGLELANSALYILLSNHFPAPKYLLHSSLSNIWFSYMSLVNPLLTIKINPKVALKVSFRGELEKEGRSYIGKYEIKDRRFKKILTCSNQKPNIDRYLLDLYDAMLYRTVDLTDFSKKSKDNSGFAYSPDSLSNEILFEKYNDFLLVYMTILEFARVFTKSFFVEFKPGNIYNNFQLNNVLQTDVEAFLELYQNLNSVEVVNCNRVPYIDKIEDGNY